jgi:enoyl-CoA hydratase
MSYQNLLVEGAGPVAVVTVNRPAVLNALNDTTLRELTDAFIALMGDAAVRCVILTGAGEKAFIAGADIAAMAGYGASEGRALSELGHRLGAVMEGARAPIIAAVNGFALGGGCELALACDFVLASERAKFSQPEINLGVFPPVAAYQLSRQLPSRKGLELLLTGDTIDAAAADRLGLVNAVFPLAEFDARADAWLQRLYKQSASSLRFARRAFRLAQTADFYERLGAVERLYLDELMQTHDANEGLNAFVEKRKPEWTGH